MPLTFGSLFAGIGGFDLGFERAGMVCRWQVEIDGFCKRILEKHWPDVRRWDDVQTWPEQSPEPVDIICGGFPCKQTSNGAAIHGRRDGLAGKDSGLWYAMLRIIEQQCPRVAVVENVAGVASWSTTITRGLAQAGYAVDEVRLAASEFGALHHRRRVFFVAYADGQRLPITWKGEPRQANGETWRTAAGNHWATDSGEFRRMAHGFSGRVDRRKRIERLGNAVVPQMAEWIGRRIVESVDR